MSLRSLKHVTIRRIIQKPISSHSSDSIGITYKILKEHHQAQGQGGSRKSKEYEISSSIFSSTFSSSSSTASKIGFVGWYLEMVKSRPDPHYEILVQVSDFKLLINLLDLVPSQARSLLTCVYGLMLFKPLVLAPKMNLTRSEWSPFPHHFRNQAKTITNQSLEQYDFVRTLRMAGYGMLVLGPSLHFWFNFMSRVLPKRDLITTFKKIILGQITYGPFMTVVFFSLNARLQGESSQEIIARLKRDLLPTFKNGVMYWPICDFITFKFIPVHLQPLVSNSFSYVWTVYVTYMAGKAK
ncbi:Mpv17/PMP22, partial [Dillenia turbinata]